MDRVEERPGSGEPGGKGEPEPGRERSQGPSKRYSAEERGRILAGYRACTGDKDEYCRQQGVSRKSVYEWLRKERGQPKGVRRGPYKPAERLQAVEAYLKSGMSLKEFGDVWGISKDTMWAWVKAYREDPRRLEGMKGGRKAGKSLIPAGVHREIATVKRDFPDFGLRKVRDFLVRFRGLKVSTGTIRKTLKREGLPPVVRVAKRHRSSDRIRRFERARPGQLWQSDITSFVLTRHSQRVYLVVFMDDHSRYVVGWRLAMRQTADMVIEALLDGVQRFGKPEEVLTDQGRQYFSWRGKGEFQRILDREGIRHVVARSHHPQTVGKCERFWETVGSEFWERVKPQELGEARQRLEHFIAHYNHFRPHQGIGGMVPADRLFGSESAVRKAIEEAMHANQLRLAVGEAPRRPVYLAGQLGDQQVSMHGEHGRIVVRTPDGVVQEIGMGELGIQKEVCDGEGDDEGAAGNVSGGGGGGPHAPQGWPEARELAGAEAGGAGEGALGVGFGGAESQGAPVGGGGDGVLAREGDEAGGGRAAADPALADLAVESAGALGHGGGASGAAEGEERGGAAGSHGRPEGLEEADRRAGEARGDAGPADRGLKGDAGLPGGEAPGGAEPEGGQAWRQEEGTAGSSR